MNLRFIPKAAIPDEFADLDPAALGWQEVEWPIGPRVEKILILNEDEPTDTYKKVEDWYELRRLDFWIDYRHAHGPIELEEMKAKRQEIINRYSEAELEEIARYGALDLWLSGYLIEVDINENGRWTIIE